MPYEVKYYRRQPSMLAPKELKWDQHQTAGDESLTLTCDVFPPFRPLSSLSS